MKKFFLLLLVLIAGFAIYNRERLYLHDPMGSLTRGGVKEAGATIFINYNNDVLIENDHAPMYLELIQQGQPIGAPANLKCAHFLVCLADADRPALVSAAPGAQIHEMSSKEVTFKDTDGREAVVTLR